jgi:hypothetical protein
LRDILLRDAASRLVETDAENFQLVMHNLSLFIDKVHNGAYDLGLVRRKSHRHIFHGFSDSPQDVGACLANAVRRTTEWSSMNFDPSPLFLIISVIVKNNPTEARVWFTSFRVSPFTY